MTAVDPLAAWDAAEDVGVVAATGRYALDASDQAAERCDDAIDEIVADRDDWDEDEVPTWDEL